MIGSPRTESSKSCNIIGNRTPSDGATPPSRVGRTTSPGESGDTLNKLPHGSVGEEDEEDEDDSPNDGNKSEDSDRRSVGKSFDCGSGFPTTVASVATAGVLVSKLATVLFTVSGGSAP